jgi:arylsulfatase A-like enzyme
VSTPVSNFDVFPTLLELAGIEPPPGLDSKAVSLLDPIPDRWRLAEYPSDFEKPLRNVGGSYPEWDPTPFRRRLTGLFDEEYKLIWSSDGRHELYHLGRDPDELDDLAAAEPEKLVEMLGRLGEVLTTLELIDNPGAPKPELPEEQKQRLEALGYFGDDEDSEDDGGS